MNDAVAETASGVVVGIDEILKLIPHRPPFLMIDRGEDFVAFRSMTGVKAVTINEPFFVGHFPDYPVMPGVMLVEAIAQTGGVLMSKSMDLKFEQRAIFFTSVDNCRFRYPVRPGDMLHMPVEVLRARPDVARFKGRALVGDKLAAELEFTAVVVDRV
ncbi:MAG TPA: 3-hydroxyacyl-ACP dehydratase FabZ [Caulobacteraceae bacterium]|nr:3-hydroxyacyl-ACP dehydratase FabZ [Caulobacteraceae bacterium]